MTPTPHTLVGASPALVVGLAMLRMGLRRNLLAIRSNSRRCASCRRRIDTPYCPHCTR
jgi:hypothetical protein